MILTTVRSTNFWAAWTIAEMVGSIHAVGLVPVLLKFIRVFLERSLRLEIPLFKASTIGEAAIKASFWTCLCSRTTAAMLIIVGALPLPPPEVGNGSLFGKLTGPLVAAGIVAFW